MNEAPTTEILVGAIADVPAELIDVPAVPTVIRNRDSRGRFQRPPIHIARAKATGCLFYEVKDGTTHSRNHCGDIRGRVRRCHSSARGWLCTVCIEVDGCTDDDTKATKIGSARCEGCDVMLTMTKYPTVLVSGVGQIRDFRVCRKCRKSGIHPVGEFGVDPSDAEALAEAVANDWRPRTTAQLSRKGA